MTSLFVDSSYRSATSYRFLVYNEFASNDRKYKVVVFLCSSNKKSVKSMEEGVGMSRSAVGMNRSTVGINRSTVGINGSTKG